MELTKHCCCVYCNDGDDVVNCFHAELPTAMCEASTVEVLSLNGLGTAEGCPNAIKVPFTGVSLFNDIGGTLPECVWHLRNLTTLHVAGNGLTGTVISRLPDHSSLVDLSLSHNQFSGSIPLGVQLVEKVDLSYNQFSGKYEEYTGGTWKSNFIDVEINRLSGQLPVARLENVSSLYILKGNMFSCDSIPSGDKLSSEYTCGSDDLNESLYVFCSSVVVISCVALAVCVASISSNGGSKRSLWHSARKHFCRFSGVTTNVTDVESPLCDKFSRIKWLFLQLLVVMLVTASPVYIVRDRDDYSTHSETYSWFWTLAYLRGVLPSCLILMSWAVAIAVCFYRIFLVHWVTESPVPEKGFLAVSDNQKDSGAKSNQAVKSDLTGSAKGRAWLIAMFAVNGAVAITVNTLYIYSTNQPLSDFALFGIQLSLAVFRVAYSYFVIPLLSRSVTSTVDNIAFRLRLLTVTNLVVPCITTAFASPSCFQVMCLSSSCFMGPRSCVSAFCVYFSGFNHCG